jgi:hypothetical protein
MTFGTRPPAPGTVIPFPGAFRMGFQFDGQFIASPDESGWRVEYDPRTENGPIFLGSFLFLDEAIAFGRRWAKETGAALRKGGVA